MMNLDPERRSFLEMVGRIGYAVPRHYVADARARERSILNELCAMGILKEAYEKVDRYGEPNARGRHVRTVWIATDVGLPLAEAARAEAAKRLRAATEELAQDHTTLE